MIEYICRVGLLNKKILFLHSQLSFYHFILTLPILFSSAMQCNPCFIEVQHVQARHWLHSSQWYFDIDIKKTLLPSHPCYFLILVTNTWCLKENLLLTLDHCRQLISKLVENILDTFKVLVHVCFVIEQCQADIQSTFRHSYKAKIPLGTGHLGPRTEV